VKAASAKLNAIPGVGTGRMGLTPDGVKFSSAYRGAAAELAVAMANARRFNAWYTKAFKKELRAERDAKRKRLSNG
jgi:hypothetical protein